MIAKDTGRSAPLSARPPRSECGRKQARSLEKERPVPLLRIANPVKANALTRKRAREQNGVKIHIKNFVKGGQTEENVTLIPVTCMNVAKTNAAFVALLR